MIEGLEIFFLSSVIVEGDGRLHRAKAGAQVPSVF